MDGAVKFTGREFQRDAWIVLMQVAPRAQEQCGQRVGVGPFTDRRVKGFAAPVGDPRERGLHGIRVCFYSRPLTDAHIN